MRLYCLVLAEPQIQALHVARCYFVWHVGHSCTVYCSQTPICCLAVELLGPQSMLIVQEPRHRFLRGLMQPAFTAEAIATTLPLVTEVVDTYLSNWEASSGPVVGAAEVKAMTFDIIIQVSMSAATQLANHVLTACMTALHCIGDRPVYCPAHTDYPIMLCTVYDGPCSQHTSCSSADKSLFSSVSNHATCRCQRPWYVRVGIWLLVLLQVAIGRMLPMERILRLRELFKVWTMGIMAFPSLNLPFTPYWNSMRARDELIQLFQEEVDRARVEITAGGAPAAEGILGDLILAVDEDGNR